MHILKPEHEAEHVLTGFIFVTLQPMDPELRMRGQHLTSTLLHIASAPRSRVNAIVECDSCIR